MTTPVDNRDPQDDHVRVYYVQMTEEQYDGFRSVSEKHQDFIDATFVYRVDDSGKYRRSRSLDSCWLCRLLTCLSASQHLFVTPRSDRARTVTLAKTVTTILVPTTLSRPWRPRLRRPQRSQHPSMSRPPETTRSISCSLTAMTLCSLPSATMYPPAVALSTPCSSLSIRIVFQSWSCTLNEGRMKLELV